MVGETAETRGLFLGCGMNSVGMASGGDAGMNLANAIVHGQTAYDLGESDAKRFMPISAMTIARIIWTRCDIATR